MKKYNPSSSNRNTSDSRPKGRAQSKFPGRAEAPIERSSSDRPRSDSRSEGRSFSSDRPRSERPEGRPFSSDRPRSAGRPQGRPPESRDRPFSSDRPRSDRPFSDRPRSAGRPQGRSLESRDRPFSSDRPRSDRPEGRSFFDRPSTNSRGERKPFSSDRPRPDSRSEGRPFSSDRPRSAGRPQGRPPESRDRPFSSDRPRSDRPEGRSFGDRPRSDSRPERKPFSSDRPRPEGRSEGRPFGDRPRSDSRPERKPFSSDRPRQDNRPERKPVEAEAKPFVVYRKNPDDVQEIKYYGFHACLKLWDTRPDDVIRVYVDEKCVKQVSQLLKWCATKAKAYHVVSEEEMAKVSDSVHHEGLCILAKEPKSQSFEEMLEELQANSEPACLLYLDGVQNPHNIGSIMRVCAHFGIKYILGQKSLLPKVTPSAYRVAQGGAEHVKLIPLDDIKISFKKLEEAGFKTVASSSHGGHSLYNYKFQPRMIIVMGSESEGVNDQLLKSSQDTLLIPGSGAVESLNVSVATGLVLGEYYRQVKST